MRYATRNKQQSYMEWDTELWRDILRSKKYSLRAVGKLVKAAAMYLRTGEEPDFRGFPELSAVWDSVKGRVRLVNAREGGGV